METLKKLLPSGRVKVRTGTEDLAKFCLVLGHEYRVDLSENDFIDQDEVLAHCRFCPSTTIAHIKR